MIDVPPFTPDEAQALRADALQRAADEVLDWQGRVAMGTAHANAEHDATLSRISSAVLALADETATAALDRIRAEALAEALRKAADKIGNIIRLGHEQLLRDYDVDVEIYRNDPDASDAVKADVDAILAALTPAATGG